MTPRGSAPSLGTRAPIPNPRGESDMSMMDETAKAARRGDKEGLREVLDFLITEEALGVTLVTAAIERAEGTPSEAFLPVLRNAVTQEFHHVEALRAAGGKPLTTSYWLPDSGVRRRKRRALLNARNHRDGRDQPLSARRERVRPRRIG